MNFFVTLSREAMSAHTPWLLFASLAALLFARSPKRPERRHGTMMFCLGAHLFMLLLTAAFHGQSGDLSSDLRLIAWIFGALAFVGSVSALVFLGLLSRTRIRVPRIVEDVVVGIVSVIAATAAASRAGMNLSGIIATSAVLTAILGFSLQDVIGNVASGLALEVDPAILVGDWIRVGDVTGKVVEVRWRYTSIETRNGETVLLPNSVLMRSQVTLLGRHAGQPLQLRRWIHFNVDWKHQPSDVIDTVETALRATPIARVAAHPPPGCVLMDMAESSGHYAVRYWLTDIAVDDPTDSDVRTRIYFALNRAGIKLALPAHALHLTEHVADTPAVKTERQAARRKHLLKAVGFFDTLHDPEFDELAATLRYAPFTRGEVMTRQGAEAHWLYLIEDGAASVRIAEGRVEREVAKLMGPSVFGEMSLLTGAPRVATVVAETDVECFRLDKGAFKRVLAQRPELMTHFADLLAKRTAELEVARDGLDALTPRPSIVAESGDLLERIQSFFSLD